MDLDFCPNSIIILLFSHLSAFFFGVVITAFFGRKIPQFGLFVSEFLIIGFWGFAMWRSIAEGVEMPLALNLFFAAVLGSLSEKISEFFERIGAKFWKK